MNPYSLIFLISVVTCILLIFTIIKHRSNNYSLSILFFLILLALSILMGISHFFIANSQTKEVFEFWNYWDLLALALIPPMELSYALAFTGKEHVLKKFQYVLLFYIPTLIVVFLLWNTNLLEINDFGYAVITPWGYSITPGQNLNFFTLYHISYYIPAYILMIRFYSLTKEMLKKKQTLLIIIALSIPTVGGVFFQGILPGIFGLPAFPASSPLVTITNLIITYAILKYSLTMFNPVLLASLVFQTMKEGVLGISNLLDVEYLNSGAKNLLGYPTDLIMGAPIKKFLRDGSSYNKLVQGIANWPIGETFIKIDETKITTHGNKEIFVDLSASKIETENKVVLGYVLVLSDITEIKRYMSKLMILTEGLESAVYERTKNFIAERDKLFFILSGITDAVIAIDLQRRIVTFNKSSEKLFGIYTADVLGKPIDEVIKIFSNNKELSKEEYAPIREDSFEGVLFHKNGLKITRSNLLIKASGQYEIYANVISGKIKEGQNAGLGCILTFHDVTDEERLARTKDDFVTSVSHQLRTPLTIIIDYLSVFMSKNNAVLSTEQKQSLNVIVASSERLKTLIERLIYVSKIETGNLLLDIKPIAWMPYISKIINDFQAIAMNKQIELSLQYMTPPHQIVFADKIRIGTVLSNLLDNAIAHTGTGGKIKVFVEEQDNHIITKVIDSGEGIPKDVLPYIFDKFSSVSKALVTDSVKTGLGLYISKSIVEMHKGKIWVESTLLGQGSTFSFSLPTKATQSA